ncbi:MAG: hypothetical protein HOG79_09960, partial [Prolixibacteraceae bacterium]|nr:hypothetical protein [Prolixibacteraceae bacterium]
MNLDRKDFIQAITALATVVSFMPTKLFAQYTNNPLEKLILKIGNTNDEKRRAKLLEDALKNPLFSSNEKEILGKLFFIADRWANGFEKYANPGSEGNESSGYLCGFIRECKIDRFFFPQLEESNLFSPIIAFYRSRMLLAHLIQNGQISLVPENRNKYINESLRLLKISQRSYPENELIKGYLGNYKPWNEIVEANQKAPDWANYQRMVLEKLTYLIHWWVDNRQISDGQFGGGWGDDVEMWRNWVPVLFAFEDKKAVNSKEKLFEGLYALSKMEKGYTKSMSDVEHTSEEYSDPLTCMLNLQAENPVWEKRALQVLDYIENLWSGINQRGQLQFKSTWFNVDTVDLNDKRACDSPYHTRLVQPLMLIWLRTGNERVGRFMKSWLKTWVEATFSEENGKPNGIVPTAIHWPDGKPSGTGENWWQPENYHSPLYDYPSQQENMYECFLQAYHITKDEFYLNPIRFVAEKILLGVAKNNTEDYKEGSLEWSLAKLKDSIPEILIKYRLITNDFSFDSILENDAKGYESFIFEKDVQKLTKSMNELRMSLSLPEEFFTTEVRWTDRLFATGKYFNYFFAEKIPVFNAGFLFSSLTGSIGNFKFLPVFGVQWLTSSKEIAILTETNSTQKFEAQLFHFGNDSRKMGARFFNLENGNYKVLLNAKQQSQLV